MDGVRRLRTRSSHKRANAANTNSPMSRTDMFSIVEIIDDDLGLSARGATRRRDLAIGDPSESSWDNTTHLRG